MRTHQRIGLLAGCLALATLYVPPCLGIATHWPTRPRLSPPRAADPGLDVELQAAALSRPGPGIDGGPEERVEFPSPGSGAWVEGQ